MTSIACPSCKGSMQIDVNEANTEWECPDCGTAFLVQGTAGDLSFLITQNATRQPAPAMPNPLPAFDAREPEIKDEIYVYALECLVKGQKPRDVRKGLLEAGFTAKQADQILQKALQFKKIREEQEKLAPGIDKAAGQRNMLIGGAICLIGTVVTVVTLAAANRSGGGSVYIAWGAIVFGGIQFFRGLHQYMNA